ncbi:4-hydroxy-2-oxovalerate aldolase [Egibacter rhizosphaerae]|uniref:4-hydroxy-2-oxovalerate aldolase n=1 Tax=Egibacter rhizosphaerae TaxID=1670831 RepID=A0A411YBE8_9ACTN|nr:4-hydroxy-2-oxovalerate aldolase [Egibacter rhizosphaerae]QBI18534.1 4-hydroxy-2-oxovalerate aldolase [Egibacter rhizosphaerae]
MTQPQVRDVRITDSTLRDGSHAMSHQFTADQVRRVARGLDDAGVPVIEVSHGDGLGGSSFNYGFSREPEAALVQAAVEAVDQARIAALLLPGVGSAGELRVVADLGVSVARVATHCTEADISLQHFELARDLGMETVGFLMLSHMTDPEELAKQARIMVDGGCQSVYVVDSAGALLPEGVRDRVSALRAEIGTEAEVGVHAHNNLGMGVANSIAAVDVGAVQVDGACRSLGAGAGNAPTEVVAAVLDRRDVSTGVDLPAVMGVAEDVVRPIMHREPVCDRNAIVMGHSGVYSSFLLHAECAAERYGVPAHAILQEVGRRRYVGGQEDMIIDIAVELSGGR